MITWLEWYLPRVPVLDRILGAASPCSSTGSGCGIANHQDSLELLPDIACGEDFRKGNLTFRTRKGLLVLGCAMSGS